LGVHGRHQRSFFFKADEEQKSKKQIEYANIQIQKDLERDENLEYE
jgi:hypothetical protein